MNENGKGWLRVRGNENIDRLDSLGFIEYYTKGVSGNSTTVAEGGVFVVVFVFGVWLVKKNQGEN